MERRSPRKPISSSTVSTAPSTSSILLQGSATALIPRPHREENTPATYEENSPLSPASIICFSFKDPLPSPISPLPPSPPLPTWKQPTSEKLNKLITLRKTCFLPSKQCSYFFKKGEKRGEQCTKFCLLDEVLCCLHFKLKDKKITSHISHQTAKLYKTRINKLRKHKKYFFVKVIEQTTVRLRCENKEFILKLPRGMINPITPTKEHYLIRESNGETVWRKLKFTNKGLCNQS